MPSRLVFMLLRFEVCAFQCDSKSLVGFETNVWPDMAGGFVKSC